MRHPQWQVDTPMDDMVVEESLGDSLKDVQELSLRLSIDGEKKSLTLEHNPVELEKVAAEKGDPELQDQVNQILNKMKKQEPEAAQGMDSSKKQPESLVNSANKYPLLRRRRRLFEIALDCYNDQGDPHIRMLQVIEEVFKAIGSDPQMARVSGFALSTAMPISETLELLKSGQIKAKDFDALICSSGSEVYYPGSYQCTEEDGKFCGADPDYAAHIDYHWGHEGVKRTIEKLMNSQDGEGDNKSDSCSTAVQEDLKSSNAHCISFFIKDPTKAKRVDNLRQKLRLRGLRCHIMYCRNSTRWQVIPLLASRSQALRYIFVRWGLSVSNMRVILGEKGNTDHEEFISGSHKTVIMKGVMEKGSEELLRTTGSYEREDMVPGESPLVVYTSDGIKSKAILRALKEASNTASGM